jgi:hypothetical protein
MTLRFKQNERNPRGSGQSTDKNRPPGNNNRVEPANEANVAPDILRSGTAKGKKSFASESYRWGLNFRPTRSIHAARGSIFPDDLRHLLQVALVRRQPDFKNRVLRFPSHTCHELW